MQNFNIFKLEIYENYYIKKRAVKKKYYQKSTKRVEKQSNICLEKIGNLSFQV